MWISRIWCILIGISLFGWACKNQEARSGEGFNQSIENNCPPTIVKNLGQNDYHTFRKSFELTAYAYTPHLADQIHKWREQLPDSIQTALLDRKLILHKSYYLSGIILGGEEKIQTIYQLDQTIERTLSNHIGLVQGIPTVLFSTAIYSSEIENSGKEETLVLEVNQLVYTEE